MGDLASLLLFLGIVGIFVFGMWLFTFLFGPKKKTIIKSRPFECGMDPIGENRTRVSVQYYIYAILLVVFDIEVIFLVPLAIIFREKATLTYFIILVFLLTALIGYIYVHKKGGLSIEEEGWEKKNS